MFSSHICQKCVICCQKTWRGCQVNLKFSTQANYLMPRKKPQNNLFTWGPQHGQNGIWNLQIFFEYLHHLKIFGILFLGWCSTRPHNLIYILPEAIDFLCKFRSCSWLCSTRTQIYMKSETAQLVNSKYFCLNNWTSRKWGLWYRSGLNL